jgi:hypothetical protein
MEPPTLHTPFPKGIGQIAATTTVTIDCLAKQADRKSSMVVTCTSRLIHVSLWSSHIVTASIPQHCSEAIREM